MDKVTLAEAFRFLLPGATLWAYYYIYCPTKAISIFSSLGLLGSTFFLLVVGGLIYLVYRPFIYNPLIRYLQDKIRRGKHNPRTYLMAEFDLSSREADLCHSGIKNKYLKSDYEALPVYASALHFLYLASILSLPFIVLYIIERNVLWSSIFTGAFIIFFFAAFFTDRIYEQMELVFLSQVDRHLIVDVIDRVKRHLFITEK